MLPFLHSNVLLSRWCQRKFPLLLRLTCACNGYILDIRRATTPSQWRRGAATPRLAHKNNAYSAFTSPFMILLTNSVLTPSSSPSKSILSAKSSTGTLPDRLINPSLVLAVKCTVTPVTSSFSRLGVMWLMLIFILLHLLTRMLRKARIKRKHRHRRILVRYLPTLIL